MGQKLHVLTSKTASADLVAPLSAGIDNLSTSGVVCGMDVRHNGVSCIPWIAWLSCDVVDMIVSDEWLPNFTMEEIDCF